MYGDEAGDAGGDCALHAGPPLTPSAASRRRAGLVDLTEGRLACRNDPRNAWTGQGVLGHFIERNDRVLDRFSAEERRNIGIHTCPGGDCDSTHSGDVDYVELVQDKHRLLPMQLASEQDKKHVYKLAGQHSRDDANGVPQVCFIGVVYPQNSRVETPDELQDDLILASKHILKSG
jgi:hypothetical protein